MYLAIVGGRGTNKTSCFEFALAPIRARDTKIMNNLVILSAPPGRSWVVLRF